MSTKLNSKDLSSLVSKVINKDLVSLISRVVELEDYINNIKTTSKNDTDTLKKTIEALKIESRGSIKALDGRIKELERPRE